MKIQMGAAPCQEICHAREQDLIGNVQALETEQACCGRNPMAVDASLVHLPGVRGDLQNIAGHSQVIEKLERVPEQIR